MRKQRFSRILAAVLSVLILTQSLCLTAFAADAVAVIIPAGSDETTVNEILTDALLGKDQETVEWEYYCTGTSKILTTNKAWGPIEGFTSQTGTYIKTTYTHPALADNADGEYQVRVTGTTDEYTIDKVSGLDAPITLAEGRTAALNTGDLKAAIFDAVVITGEDLTLSADDVTIQYQTKNLLGQTTWSDLDGLTEVGTYTIRISWDGNDIYRSYEGTVEIEVVSGLLTSAVQLRSGASAALAYDADGSLDCAATEQAIFDAVVETMVPQLTVDDVTVEYYATIPPALLAA